jgi:crotonobetainyl-CoA:carnitine CoA-transferase CaiB-like acyl-CoA transferase
VTYRESAPAWPEPHFETCGRPEGRYLSRVTADHANDASTILSGVRVVDLTSNVAAPFGSAVLADLGAEVMHVEGPHGDDCRRMSPVAGHGSAYFTVVNRNKSGMQLDIRIPGDREVLDGLVADADVFVTNLRPGKLLGLGLDADTLTARFPRLIHAALSAYGEEGAERDKPGYDAVLQGRTGIASVTGESDGPPVRAGVSILDVGAGTWLALGILAALYRREVTGQGGSVATSLLETGASWVAYHISAHQVSGEPSRRHGSGHPAFSPYGIFATGAGEICIGVGGDQLFSKLCITLDRQDLTTDERFRTNEARARYADVLRQELERTLAQKGATEWAADLGRAGLPVDAVQRPEDLLTDPQVGEMGILQSIPGPTGDPILLPGLPLRFDHQRPAFRSPAPDAPPPR